MRLKQDVLQKIFPKLVYIMMSIVENTKRRPWNQFLKLLKAFIDLIDIAKKSIEKVFQNTVI